MPTPGAAIAPFSARLLFQLLARAVARRRPSPGGAVSGHESKRVPPIPSGAQARPARQLPARLASHLLHVKRQLTETSQSVAVARPAASTALTTWGGGPAKHVDSVRRTSRSVNSSHVATCARSGAAGLGSRGPALSVRRRWGRCRARRSAIASALCTKAMIVSAADAGGAIATEWCRPSRASCKTTTLWCKRRIVAANPHSTGTHTHAIVSLRHFMLLGTQNVMVDVHLWAPTCAVATVNFSFGRFERNVGLRGHLSSLMGAWPP